jgi:hypothetical protein
MKKIICALMLALLSKHALALQHQHLQQLVLTDARIQAQSKQIAHLLNLQKQQAGSSQDWRLLRGMWVHEFDILDSLRLGINSAKLYLSIPASQRSALYALVAHHNLYIATRMCSEHVSEINQYSQNIHSATLKQAVQLQFEHAKQGCQVLRQVREELYQASQ